MGEKAAFFLVDAFTERLFGGNQAAVVPLRHWQPEGWLQAVAMEMNLSETAFCVPISSGGGGYELRWFTPQKEVDLCGHATLATAFVLAKVGLMNGAGDGASLSFSTRSGTLT